MRGGGGGGGAAQGAFFREAFCSTSTFPLRDTTTTIARHRGVGAFLRVKGVTPPSPACTQICMFAISPIFF